MADATRRIWDNCLATRQGDLAAYEAVTYGLLMSGLAMQMMGSSRPASGGEHHISHLIETEPLGLGVHSDALHGEKVGVGTVLASNEYHRLTACEDVRGHVLPYAQVDLDWLRDYFGEKLWPAAYSENEHDCLAQVTPERLTECWPEMRRIVASTPEGETVRQRLQGLGPAVPDGSRRPRGEAARAFAHLAPYPQPPDPDADPPDAGPVSAIPVSGSIVRR